MVLARLIITKILKISSVIVVGASMVSCGPDPIPEPYVGLEPASIIDKLSFEYNKGLDGFTFYYSFSNHMNEDFWSSREWIEYGKAKTKAATDYLREKGLLSVSDKLIDCSISGEIEVTSDTPIGGRPIESNLSDLLYIRKMRYIHGIMCAFPDFQPIGMAHEGMLLKDYFAEGNVLPRLSISDGVVVVLKDGIDYPESFKLTVRIPIHAVDYSKKPWNTGKEEYYDSVIQGVMEINNNYN